MSIYYALTTILCLVSHHGYAKRDNFKRFCVNPPHLGKGHLKEDECTITFPYDTESQSEAKDMCENSLPFDVKEATHGQSTKCVYERHDIICKSGEFVIGKKCFRIQGKGPSSKYVEGCGSKYHFHVLQNEFERKWVALRLPDKHGDVWTGITDEYYEASHPIGKDNRTKRAANEKIIKIHMKGKKNSKLIKGKLLRADPQEVHPYLCSRIGKAKHHKASGEEKPNVTPSDGPIDKAPLSTVSGAAVATTKHTTTTRKPTEAPTTKAPTTKRTTTTRKPTKAPTTKHITTTKKHVKHPKPSDGPIDRHPATKKPRKKH